MIVDTARNKIASKRQETIQASSPIYATSPPAILTQFSMVSSQHVIRLIGSAPCKHSEADPLPTWLLKECSRELGTFLAALFNNSLSSATFPSRMKRATVVHVLKKDNLYINELMNYRPVSNLSFISKLLERIVSEQLMDYFNKFDLIPGGKSAYRTG